MVAFVNRVTARIFYKFQYVNDGDDDEEEHRRRLGTRNAPYVPRGSRTNDQINLGLSHDPVKFSQQPGILQLNFPDHERMQ